MQNTQLLHPLDDAWLGLTVWQEKLGGHTRVDFLRLFAGDPTTRLDRDRGI